MPTRLGFTRRHLLTFVFRSPATLPTEYDYFSNFPFLFAEISGCVRVTNRRHPFRPSVSKILQCRSPKERREKKTAPLSLSEGSNGFMFITRIMQVTAGNFHPEYSIRFSLVFPLFLPRPSSQTPPCSGRTEK